MVIVMHQGFLSLLILSRALISNARLQSHAVLHLSWVVAGLGWAGLAARPAGTAPRLRGIRQAAVQLEPLGWESLKQQTSQNKGMFHCFFWLSGFLFSKELLQAPLGQRTCLHRALSQSRPLSGRQVLLLDIWQRKRLQKISCDLCQRPAAGVLEVRIFFFLFLSLREFCPICYISDYSTQYFRDKK